MLVARYPTRKALKAAVGQPLRYEETSLHGDEYRDDGRLTVVGPGAYDRRWYAQITMQQGVIVKVS
jgi:hypothetical protein